MEYFVPNVPVIPMDPSRAMGDYLTLSAHGSTGCLFCKENGHWNAACACPFIIALFTPGITWHPKIMVARLISVVLPGMCYASFRENIHYLNSIQVITSSIEGLKEPDSEKKMAFGMYGHLLLPEMKE